MQFPATAILGFAILFNAPISAPENQQQRVDAIFASYDQSNSPGCALGVIQAGNVVYRKAFGMGSVELDVPLTPQSVFYMGSVSKQFTAASVVLAINNAATAGSEIRCVTASLISARRRVNVR